MQMRVSCGANMAQTAFYAGRPWGAVGDTLYFAAGADTTWSTRGVLAASEHFTVPGLIRCLKPLSVGLAVFTTDDLHIVAGTDDTTFTLSAALSVSGGRNPAG